MFSYAVVNYNLYVLPDCEHAKPQRVWNQDADIMGSHDVIGHKDAESQRFLGHDFDLLGPRDVIGHVTIRLAVVTFLLVVNDDHTAILHRYGDIKPQSCV